MIRLFNRYWSLAALLSLAVESLLLLGTLSLAYQARFWIYFGRVGEVTPAYFYSNYPLRAGVFVSVVILSLYANGLYDFSERLNIRLLLARMVRAFALAGIALLVIYYVTYPALTTGRGVFALAMTLGGGLLLGWRLLLRSVLRKNPFGDRVLIVGTDQTAMDLARELLVRSHLGYRVVGFLDPDPAVQGKSLLNPRVIGVPNQVCQLALAHRVDRVVVAQCDTRGKLDMDRLLDCKTSGVPVELCSDYYERLTGKIMLEGLRKSWLIFSGGFVISPSLQTFKRMGDVVVAAMALVLGAPLMLLTAIAIKLDSRGPVLYRQERVGLGGKPFTVWKFRSMRTDAERTGKPKWAQENDPRITRVGHWIRKLRIDELPQLWNVLVGTMSLVGPRPERQVFVDQLRQMSPYYEQRLTVRPGITGWAQIMAPYAATFEDSLEKLSYDLYYVKNLSLFLDLSIMLSTIRIVLFGRGAR